MVSAVEKASANDGVRDARQEQDLALMRRVAERERSAQVALIARLSGRVSRVARTLLRDAADADDAAQLALIEVLRSAGGYRGLGSIERFADGIVVRVAGRLVRERQRALKRVDPEAEVDSLSAPGVEAAWLEDTARPIVDYLNALPDGLRYVLMLKHGFGYSLDEISELIDATPNAAKKRLHRANQALRRMIRRDRVVGIHLGRGAS